MIFLKLIRRTLSVFLLVIVLFGAVRVDAVANDSYTAKLASDFVVAKNGDDLTEIATVLGMTEDALEKFIDENGVLFVAADVSNSVQVRLSKHKTEFSTLAGDISLLDDNGVEELADSISSQKGNFSVDSSNGREYIKSVRNLSDSGGKYVSVQYTTVMDGYIYQLSVYAAQGSADDTADKIFKGLVLYPQGSEKAVPVLWTVGFAVLIALFTTLFVVALVGLIKNRKSAQEDDQPEENTEIE